MRQKIGIIFLFILAISEMGCKAGITLGGIGTSNAGTTPTDTNRNWQDQAATCGNGPAVQTPMGIWTVTQTAGQYSQQLTISIEDASTTITASCSYQMVNRVATVTAQSHFQGKVLIIDQSLTKTAGDQNLMCSVSIPSGQLNYGFKGNCIQIKLNGAVHTLTHVSQ